MGRVSDAFDIVDNCAEFYNFLFVTCKIERINEEMNYLYEIRNNSIQIRNYFLGFSGQIYMPLKVWYIWNVLNCSDRELKERLINRYQTLIIIKNQIIQNKIDTRPIKFTSNVCKVAEDIGR